MRYHVIIYHIFIYSETIKNTSEIVSRIQTFGK